MSLTVFIDGIGLLAPGFVSWPTARDVLAGRTVYAAASTVLPPPEMLPAAERRRASRLVKAALGAGLAAVQDTGVNVALLATVFSSSAGDGHNCHALCETLASADRSVSPTRFHNSVHNAAAGYWGIATGARAPSQVLGAYDAGFAVGLLEAATQVATTHAPILLIVYDAEYPEPIHAKRPVSDAGSVALLLAPEPGVKSCAALHVSLADMPLTRMKDAALEKLRVAIPALRALPLLELLACRQAGIAYLEYLAPLSLQVDVMPC
jgi:hypothetical protein